MIATASESRISDCMDEALPDRTGSLRPIGDIVGELLAGYDLLGPVAAMEAEAELVVSS